MKKFITVFSFLLFIYCKDKNEAIKVEDVEITESIKIERFDIKYSQCKPEKLKELQKQYPELFPNDYPEEFWLDKMKNENFIMLNKEVQKKFNATESLQKNIEELVSRVKHYFPDEKTPRVITLTNDLIIEKKAFYTKDFILIPLDLYLGKNHEFYDGFENYQRANLEPEQILPEIVTNFAFRKIIPSQDKSLLAEMIYFGKLHYLKDVLLPHVSDHSKIGYTQQHYKFCIENESMIWAYFLENNLLYDSNIRNTQKFIEESPYTKFGREIDKESPGRIGQWMGWQIVRSYMIENEIPIEELMKKEPSEIFKNSGYKPKK